MARRKMPILTCVSLDTRGGQGHEVGGGKAPVGGHREKETEAGYDSSTTSTKVAHRLAACACVSVTRLSLPLLLLLRGSCHLAMFLSSPGDVFADDQACACACVCVLYIDE